MVAMMFVKHCPDHNLAAIFKFKAPDKWTASEIQEHLDRYQTEMKEQALSKSKRIRPVGAHVQAPVPDDSGKSCHPAGSPVQSEGRVTSNPPCSDDCLKVLFNLFKNAQSQKGHAVHRPVSSDLFQHSSCRVCQSVEHSTLAHCRQKRLCLACFQPNHIRRNCPNCQPNQAQGVSPSQDTPPLN